MAAVHRDTPVPPPPTARQPNSNRHRDGVARGPLLCRTKKERFPYKWVVFSPSFPLLGKSAESDPRHIQSPAKDGRAAISRKPGLLRSLPSHTCPMNRLVPQNRVSEGSRLAQRLHLARVWTDVRPPRVTPASSCRQVTREETGASSAPCQAPELRTLQSPFQGFRGEAPGLGHRAAHGHCALPADTWHLSPPLSPCHTQQQRAGVTGTRWGRSEH